MYIGEHRGTLSDRAGDALDRTRSNVTYGEHSARARLKL
jgi:hypothetical protein